MRSLILIMILPVLAGCMSLTDNQCRSGDWASIGFNDGVNGRVEGYISRHFEACQDVGIVPDTQTWLRGRAQGLLQYCTPQNAYRVGRSGRGLSAVCPSSTMPALIRAHQWGDEYHELEQQIREVESDINALESQIHETLQHAPLTPEQSLLLSQINSQIRRLERELTRIEDRQQRYAFLPF